MKYESLARVYNFYTAGGECVDGVVCGQEMVSLTRSLFQMPRVRVVLYNYDQICRGKDAIKDILPLTIMNIK